MLMITLLSDAKATVRASSISHVNICWQDCLLLWVDWVLYIAAQGAAKRVDP